MRLPLQYPKNVPLFALLVYCFTAFLLPGYFHPDEHYQLLEFANFKAGHLSAHELPWEFAWKIRPSLQPWIAFLVMKLWDVLQVTDPYAYTFSLRLLTAILAVVTITVFVRAHVEEFHTTYRKAFYWSAYFLWFIPIILVRFSSETWSALLFMLAITSMQAGTVLTFRQLFNAGILTGLAFLFRFQTGVMFAGLIAWLWLIHQTSLRGLLFLTLGWAIVFILGMFLDRLFYGEWTVTAWNYFHANIVQDVASHFGVVTWYHFLGNIVLDAVAPVGLILLLAYVCLLWNAPKDKVIWITTPFLLIHLLIPHKEMRFIFPIAVYLPYILLKSAQSIMPSGKGVIQPLWAVFFAINTGILMVAAFIAPSGGRMVITQFIRERYNETTVYLYTMEKNNPYAPHRLIRQKLYENPTVKTEIIGNYGALENRDFSGNGVHLVVIRRSDLKSAPQLEQYLTRLHFKEEKAGRPSLARSIFSIYNDGAQLPEYILYQRQASQ